MTEQLNNYLITKLWFFTEALYNCTVALSCTGENSKVSAQLKTAGGSQDGDSHSQSVPPSPCL